MKRSTKEIVYLDSSLPVVEKVKKVRKSRAKKLVIETTIIKEEYVKAPTLDLFVERGLDIVEDERIRIEKRQARDLEHLIEKGDSMNEGTGPYSCWMASGPTSMLKYSPYSDISGCNDDEGPTTYELAKDEQICDTAIAHGKDIPGVNHNYGMVEWISPMGKKCAITYKSFKEKLEAREEVSATLMFEWDSKREELEADADAILKEHESKWVKDGVITMSLNFINGQWDMLITEHPLYLNDEETVYTKSWLMKRDTELSHVIEEAHGKLEDKVIEMECLIEAEANMPAYLL